MAGRESSIRNRSVARAALIGALIASAVVIASWLVLLVLPGYRNLELAFEFAGTNDRLAARLEEIGRRNVSIADARYSQILGWLFAVVWGTVGYALFSRFWDACWDAGPATRVPGKLIGFIPLGGIAIALIERIFILATLRTVELADGTSSVAFAPSWKGAIPLIALTLGWMKWVLAIITIMAVTAMIVSALTAAVQRRNQRTHTATSFVGPLAAPGFATDLDGTGICCSGGGIRAASFALGGLSALERHQPPEDVELDHNLGILGSAKYLASVSGGGYAAAAWRIAAGTGALPAEPIIGDPTAPDLTVRRHPPADEPAANLLQHIRERRRFLANGAGGLPRSVIKLVLLMCWHIGLLLLAVFALSWPIGRLLVTWPIADLGRTPLATSEGIAFELGKHQWFPPVALGGAALAVWSVRLLLPQSVLRRRIDGAGAGLAGIAAGAAITLVALPYLLDLVVDVVNAIPGGSLGRLTVSGVYATALAMVWQVAKERLKRVAKFMGGLLLAVGVAVWSVLMMAQAADTDAVFSSVWVWIGAIAAVVFAFVRLNPDSWSLHDFYRSRLTGTFVTKLVDGGLLPREPTKEPVMSDYYGAPGPQPIVCCAASRREQTDTGIAALSMTFEPSSVTVFHWEAPKPNATPRLVPRAMSHEAFVDRLPPSRRGTRLGSIMGAAAVSGAAVAPSMGRLNMSTTNALLAALNARLGVWVPNPAYWPTADSGRRAEPRLANMFKEIFQIYDNTKDPNVYATDGGHWENLGLVELIRRRCETIICIDASGDPPGTYATLKQAIKLAQHECGATVVFDDDSWARLVLREDGLAPANYVVGDVLYLPDPDGTQRVGRLLYVKAAVAATTSMQIQRYAAGDTTFPNYSTINQMLTDAQMMHLIRLGYEGMQSALDTHPEIVARVFGIGDGLVDLTNDTEEANDSYA